MSFVASFPISAPAIPKINGFFFPGIQQGFDVPQNWSPVNLGSAVDAVILTAHLPSHTLDILLERVSDPLIPVLSLVPDSRAGVDDLVDDRSAWERAQNIHMRLAQLHGDIRASEEPEDILLARMFSRASSLEAVHDASETSFVRYPVAGRLRNAAEIAEGLHAKGYLTRRFFDRMPVCPGCRSSRLSVREECSACRSAQIREEPVIHHFRCGHIARESLFRTGTQYECPKCGQSLRHIGLDYDKPGSMVHCADCGAVNDKPSVGFRCVSCHNHYDTEQIPSRDWYCFDMTPRAVGRLLRGQSRIGDDVRAGSDAFGPILEHTVRESREFNIPFQVVRLNFTKAAEIRAQNVRLWSTTLNLIQDGLRSALRETDVVRQDNQQTFLVLMPHTSAKEAKRALGMVATRLGSVLKAEAGLEYAILGQDSIRKIREAL